MAAPGRYEAGASAQVTGARVLNGRTPNLPGGHSPAPMTRRRGIVSPEIDWEDEQTRIETDGPTMDTEPKTAPKVDAK